MSADLHIHVFEGITEEDLAILNSNVLGSRWFGSRKYPQTKEEWDERERARDKVWHTPNIWVGEVSWLKAVLYDKPENFIPAPVDRVAEIIDEDLPVIDDALIEKIVAAFDLPNRTFYSLAHVGKIKAFLEKHKGKRVFTVSW